MTSTLRARPSSLLPPGHPSPQEDPSPQSSQSSGLGSVLDSELKPAMKTPQVSAGASSPGRSSSCPPFSPHCTGRPLPGGSWVCSPSPGASPLPGWVLGTTSWDPGQLLHCPPGTLEGDLETALTSQHLLGESPPARPSLQRSDTQASGRHELCAHGHCCWTRPEASSSLVCAEALGSMLTGSHRVGAGLGGLTQHRAPSVPRVGPLHGDWSLFHGLNPGSGLSGLVLGGP